MKTYYRRKLPHINPSMGTFFVTTRLEGTLPDYILQPLIDKKNAKLDQLGEKFMNGELTSEEASRERDRVCIRHFLDVDRLMHKQHGNKLLANPEVASIVSGSFHWFDGEEIKLLAYCIMPDHTHKVFSLSKPETELYTLMQRFKSFTTTRCNKVLNRQGRLWQEEHFDHLIRRRDQEAWLINYTLENPVKAGLVKHWRDWPFSYVAPGLGVGG